MQKEIIYAGRKFKVRHFLDADVREIRIDPITGEEYSITLGDIEGVEIYDIQGNLIGSFDYMDFNNNEIIRKIIEQIY
jgi:hypothetical protein